jgi:flagellin-specific chaperone FliS
MINKIIKSLEEQKDILLKDQTENFDEHIQNMDAIIEQLSSHVN